MIIYLPVVKLMEGRHVYVPKNTMNIMPQSLGDAKNTKCTMSCITLHPKILAEVTLKGQNHKNTFSTLVPIVQ